jgi:hypothetical protein
MSLTVFPRLGKAVISRSMSSIVGGVRSMSVASQGVARRRSLIGVAQQQRFYAKHGIQQREKSLEEKAAREHDRLLLDQLRKSLENAKKVCVVMQQQKTKNEK